MYLAVCLQSPGEVHCRRAVCSVRCRGTSPSGLEGLRWALTELEEAKVQRQGLCSVSSTVWRSRSDTFQP